MPAGQKFNQFVADRNTGVHNLASDVLKVMLVNAPAPLSTHRIKADVREIVAGNGYVAGGSVVKVTKAGQLNGVFTLAAAKVSIAASRGSIGPFRYVVLYNDTPLTDPLIAFWDYGSDGVKLNDGEMLDIKFDAEDPGTILIDS